jgi:iron complex transport system ATP-binding protein
MNSRQQETDVRKQKNPPILTTHNLTIRIGPADGNVLPGLGRKPEGTERKLPSAGLVCRGLDFSLVAGEILVILGKNGVGKSTLLATLAGLRPPEAGEILLAGRDYAEHGVRTAARLRGWLGQRQEDPFAASVLETALTGRHPHLSRWQWEGEAQTRIVDAALADMGLAGTAHRTVQSLSGGERQRLAIATLLIQEAPLMFLDEPLTHLDLNHQIAVLERLSRSARAGAALVLVLHDPGLALRYAQHCLLLYEGGEAILGESESLLTPENLTRLYGYPLLQAKTAGRTAFIPA